ncbi:TadE/TadG family type IV pilus assembly protein [Rhodosalinus sp. 5P4]|uniref:TadE/TadG family type IV pilus assembly protein n=1 Tax=Rhodosalinus sp. 5P4 TaxID=3239196 RepID=UPI0035265144
MMTLWRDRLRCFLDETRGSLTVEAVILMPIILWAFSATYVFFDMFRQNSVTHKAAFTIGDMLSRETLEITPTYLDNTLTLFDMLTDGELENPGVRVSVVRWDEDTQSYDLRWSQSRGGAGELTPDQVADWDGVLPSMVDEEQIILVQTWADYNPLFRVGIGQQQFETFVFTRPRFAPQLVWSDS